MRVLLIEDDDLTTRAVGMVLRKAGFDFASVKTGEEGVEFAAIYDYDAIILDLTLPDMDGCEVLRQLRLANIMTPVLVLSGDADASRKVLSLTVGGDDYVTKPFEANELTARLHALVRRSRGLAAAVVTTGTLTVDLTARTVSVGGQRVATTSREYDIMELLTLRKGLTLTKDMFLTHIYGGRDEPESKIIDVFICKLRKKLAQTGDGAADCIETVWGRGYSLRDPAATTMFAAA